MSALTRYRLANVVGLWLPTAVFATMIIAGVALAPLSHVAGTVFVVFFLALFIVLALGLACTAYAFATVRCGECEKRFFDLVFLVFPVQGGCRRCAEPIEHAHTVKLAQLFSIGK